MQFLMMLHQLFRIVYMCMEKPEACTVDWLIISTPSPLSTPSVTDCPCPTLPASTYACFVISPTFLPLRSRLRAAAAWLFVSEHDRDARSCHAPHKSPSPAYARGLSGKHQSRHPPGWAGGRVDTRRGRPGLGEVNTAILCRAADSAVYNERP